MKKIILLALPFAFAMSCIFVSHAQNGIISTVGGTGTSGFSGDGGQATAAQFSYPTGVATDASGNIYFVDYTWVRKITSSGIVTTVAGNGSMTFSGDGGPATAAGLSVTSYIGSIAVDHSGNIYVADDYNRIRKISTSGIINTIAGNGTSGISGDGGPATSAAVETGPIAVDNAGNVYIAQYNNTIRKINSSGIINTIAGNGTTGFSGDGGPAIAASFHNPCGMGVDQSGNLYVADSGNARIRMITPSGIVNTIAGGASTSGPLGDGGLAISAAINGPMNVSIDAAGNIFVLETYGTRIRRINNHGIITTIAGNGSSGFSGDGLPGVFATMRANGITAGINGLFIADAGNYRIRKVIVGPNIASYVLFSSLNIICKGAQFSLLTYPFSSSSSIRTWYGDGTSDSTIVLLGGTGGYANVIHQYPASGTYTVKHVYRVSGAPVDSIQYTFEYNFCNILPISSYYDVGGTCSYSSSSDPLSSAQTIIQIAKNGVAVDTVSMISGLFYKAYGVPGDLFSYALLSSPPALTSFCPATKTISDTLQTGIDTADTKYFGFGCVGTCGYDLDLSATTRSGIHAQAGYIYIANISPYSVAPTVTVHFSPKYVYTAASPAPSGTTSNSITWNLSLIDYASSPISLWYNLSDNPSTGFLHGGDTVTEYFTVGPTSGDVDTTNNSMVVLDTVRSSFDPNEMYVSPQGYIPSGTQLQYTINFMNTGNDTAFNIYVMDTLSDFVDPSSLRLVSTANVMNITKFYDNICHNIVRFDFPNINLLDSSHHNQCTGAVSFTINTKNGLSDGTTIFNQAGIYFDQNAVVMTNTVEDIIGDSSTRVITTRSQPENGNVLIFPNPTTNELTIKTDQSTYTSFTITNTLGQLMLQQPITSATTKVSVAALPPSLYYISLKGDNGNVVRKFVKM